MPDRIPSSHSTSKMSEIMKMACKQADERAACNDTSPATRGSAEQVFGRLFEKVAKEKQASKKKLRKLAESMDEGTETVIEGDGEAGMAFIAQFIDHDLTFDATTQLGTPVEGSVEDIPNFRSPRLDLDCVYGDGPEVSPWLYDGPYLLFGRKAGEGSRYANPLDLARNRVGTALIGDPRNDENAFLSQVHGRMFVARHNEIVADTAGSSEERYEHAREVLTEEYHTLVIERFLPQVVHADVLDPLIANAKEAAGRGQTSLNAIKGIDWQTAPDLPVEFGGGVFRFGHTWIRQFYQVNDNEGREKVAIFANPDDDDSVDLRGFSPVIKKNNLHLPFFFGDSAQRAARIDTKIPGALIRLPGEVVGNPEKDIQRNLAFRNMQRGQHTFEIPSGEQVAKIMGIKAIEPHETIKKLKLEGQTPLWFYALAEAEAEGNKEGGLFRLTGVGGTIVAGVLLNMMLRGRSPYFFGE